ncbi:MAG: hypothetical protein IJP61_13350 [Treponema sp.]|nr:hypothetical protein [Treponema sp.]
MKKSFFLFNALMTLFAIMLLASCDSGGGGGSGGGTAASNKSSITVKIGSSGSSADILGDFGPVQSDNFYYGVSFTGAGNKYGPEYVGKDGTLTFNDVPFGTYTFSLDIYTDNTKKIKLDTKTTSASVSGSYTEVTFDLSYSEYQNFYIVSDATSLLAALRGQKINGDGAIDNSKMKAGDETTYAKIYVTKDIDVSGVEMGDGLVVEEGIYGAVVNLGGNTLTFENFTVEDNVNAVFKDGSIVAQNIILSGNSSLSFDKIALSQAEGSDSALIGLYEGTMSFSNDSTITSEQKIAVMGGTLTFDDTAITCNSDTPPVITTTADLPDYSAIIQNGGNVVMGGDSKITCKNLISVYVGGGSFTMDASTAENIFDGESSTPCIYVTAGIFDMTRGSSVTGYSYGIAQLGGTVVVNDSTVIGKSNQGEYQGGGTFVLVGGTVNTLVEDGTAVHMTTTSANCVTALVQSYTLDEKTYTTTNESSVTRLNCACSSNDAYILFGGDSKIDTFTFTTNDGRCYFGRVADTPNRLVSFTKSLGSVPPRVLITTPPAVSAAGFSVSYITRNQAQDLFTETTDELWSADESEEYYALPD